MEDASRTSDGGISSVVWGVETTNACSKITASESRMRIDLHRGRSKHDRHAFSSPLEHAVPPAGTTLAY